jgi:hypothetical protein
VKKSALPASRLDVAASLPKLFFGLGEKGIYERVERDALVFSKLAVRSEFFLLPLLCVRCVVAVRWLRAR